MINNIGNLWIRLDSGVQSALIGLMGILLIFLVTAGLNLADDSRQNEYNTICIDGVDYVVFEDVEAIANTDKSNIHFACE